MFKETNHNAQLDMFGDPSVLLRGRASRLYSDPNAWHNQFYQLVTSQIDEKIFLPLYKEGSMGAPTKNICRIIGMMLYKEGCGCSDKELARAVDFDLQLRGALGLFSISDEAPSIDAYYLFRARRVQHEKATGRDLLGECFASLTGLQMKKFNIGGKSIRMDSKLIGSNIAWHSRYQIVHGTLRKEMKLHAERLGTKLRAEVETILSESAKQTVYESRCLWMNFVKLMIYQTAVLQSAISCILGLIWSHCRTFWRDCFSELCRELFYLFARNEPYSQPSLLLNLKTATS